MDLHVHVYVQNTLTARYKYNSHMPTCVLILDFKRLNCIIQCIIARAYMICDVSMKANQAENIREIQ